MKITLKLTLAVIATAFCFATPAKAQSDIPWQIREMMGDDVDDVDEEPEPPKRTSRIKRFGLRNSSLIRSRSSSSLGSTLSRYTRSSTSNRSSSRTSTSFNSYRPTRSYSSSSSVKTYRPSSYTSTRRSSSSSAVRSYLDRLKNRKVSFGIQTGPSRWQKTKTELNKPGGARRIFGYSNSDVSRRWGIARPFGR